MKDTEVTSYTLKNYTHDNTDNSFWFGFFWPKLEVKIASTNSIAWAIDKSYDSKNVSKYHKMTNAKCSELTEFQIQN